MATLAFNYVRVVEHATYNVGKPYSFVEAEFILSATTRGTLRVRAYHDHAEAECMLIQRRTCRWNHMRSLPDIGQILPWCRGQVASAFIEKRVSLAPGTGEQETRLVIPEIVVRLPLENGHVMTLPGSKHEPNEAELLDEIRSTVMSN